MWNEHADAHRKTEPEKSHKAISPARFLQSYVER